MIPAKESRTDRLGAAHRALDAGQSQGALALIEPLLAECPDDASVRWLVGRYLALHGATAEAAAQYDFAARHDPSLSHVEFLVAGEVVRLQDAPGSAGAAEILAEFARGMYGLARVPFARGDVAVDVGAHIGGVSVVLAKLHPEIRIIAYEPSASNYAMLCANLQANGIGNVTPVRQAVMGERGALTLTWSLQYSAGSTVSLPDAARLQREAAGWSTEIVPCVTLDDVFTDHGIGRCSWLKLDCETAEWGIAATTGVLERIDRMALELHLPCSRYAEGEERCTQDFLALINRVAHPPQVDVASTLWVRDL